MRWSGRGPGTSPMPEVVAPRGDMRGNIQIVDCVHFVQKPDVLDDMDA